MPQKSIADRQNRIKIGTILDKGIVDLLKDRSAREGKSISSLIEDAVLQYETEAESSKETRLKAMEQLFSIRFNITNEDWKTIMEEDYYEQ